MKLESFSLRFPDVASGGADSGPHRKKEKHDSRELSQATRHDNRTQPYGSGARARQLARDAGGRSDSDEPVSSTRQSRVILLLAALGSWKKPEGHTEYHHHDEAHEDRVGVRAHLVRIWGAQEDLASDQCPGSDREAKYEERDGSLDKTTDERVHDSICDGRSS